MTNEIPLTRRELRAVAEARRATWGHGRAIVSATSLLFVGSLLVGTSIPASALIGPPTPVAGGAGAPKVAQRLEIDAGAAASAAAPVTRDSLTVTSKAELARRRYAAPSYSYTVGSGAVRWPFPDVVPISDGWGYRPSPCIGCSSYHRGVDFTPGVSAPILAIADGVVSLSSADAYGFGTHVFIEHEVDGATVTSAYAHMQAGSTPLREGDVVKVGDLVGLVGTTGASTGPHLHFEIRLEGEQVDPFAWLTAHAS